MRIGDKVQYSDIWCKSIMADIDIASRKGEITYIGQKIGKGFHCKVKWNDGETTGCLTQNLQKTRIL